MRYGIPLLDLRIAPRITSADSFVLVTTQGRRILTREIHAFEDGVGLDAIQWLLPFRLDVLVCCGIDKSTRESLTSNRVRIIDNVACGLEEALQALQEDSLSPGYGFLSPCPERSPFKVLSGKGTEGNEDGFSNKIDCLACENRVCLKGKVCPFMSGMELPQADVRSRIILEAALDISLERERTLCRISELVYFCLEMKYRRIGLAFCLDLLEAADILARLLRRHFEVFPVLCKAGGAPLQDTLFGEALSTGGRSGLPACNPLAQAEVLNRLGTDLNVMVGLCMGVDSLFTKASAAPVTTLFVKDRSLANNPIGALYSEYYHKEVTQAPAQGG